MKKFFIILTFSLLQINVGFTAETIVDLKNSKWKMLFGVGDTIDIEFLSNGRCVRSWGSLLGKQTKHDCTWKQDGRSIEFEYANRVFTFKGRMYSNNRISGTYNNTFMNTYNEQLDIKMIRFASYLIKKEEPKKIKPKPSPDDNKIVPAGSGSGFFVSKNGTLITNFHVIEGCELNKVSYKGNQSEAKVLSIDRVNDIAILQTDIKSENAFSVSNEDVSLLEDVVVAGYPLGKEISSAIKTHKGVVTALAGAGDNYSFFQTDAAINQGNSGGPIINQKGNVVGIAVATWVEEGVQGVHFGIKSSTLKTFANANGIKFLKPNINDLSNKELGQLIMKSTVYVECHMTVAKIKKMIADAENKKAFFKDVQ
jgi:hypothetical protein